MKIGLCFLQTVINSRAGSFANTNDYPIYPLDFFNLPYEPHASYQQPTEPDRYEEDSTHSSDSKAAGRSGYTLNKLLDT